MMMKICILNIQRLKYSTVAQIPENTMKIHTKVLLKVKGKDFFSMKTQKMVFFKNLKQYSCPFLSTLPIGTVSSKTIKYLKVRSFLEKTQMVECIDNY
jgi:hypothetical protein